MCLLIVKPEGVELTDVESLCHDANDSNPDGFGIAYAGQKIKIVKGMIEVDEQIKALNKLGSQEAIIHWRFGTSGSRSKTNCHPFEIADGTVFAHNGIMPIVSLPGLSDTHTVCRSVKTHDELVLALSKHVGTGNKFAIAKPGCEISILGEQFGHWVDDVWFSNLYWRGSVVSRRQDELEEWIQWLVNEHGFDAVSKEIQKYSELGFCFPGGDEPEGFIDYGHPRFWN